MTRFNTLTFAPKTDGVKPIDRVLSRLDGVRQVGSRNWRARCPAHDSRKLTLSLAERDDRVLIHCFAGCSAGDVLSSVGLTFSQLFDSSLGEFPPLKRSPFRADDVLDLVTREAMTIALIAGEATRDKTLSALHFERLVRAASRLNHIQSVVRNVR